jgi:phenylalanine-4-hydroxylase
MNFTTDQHKIWQTLYSRQLPRVQQHACAEYLDGFAQLEMPGDGIPALDFLNARITPATGWQAVRTSVRYSAAEDWYSEFAQRHFLITDYMRDWPELDFTPEPDMFHDIFGHLPFMMLPAYAELEEMFAPAFLRANAEQREAIKRLAWYSTEFGVKRENGAIKMFGAGLISSAGEFDRVVAGETPLAPFKVASIIPHEKAIWEYNHQLFVFETMDELKAELAGYFDTI